MSTLNDIKKLTESKIYKNADNDSENKTAGDNAMNNNIFSKSNPPTSSIDGNRGVISTGVISEKDANLDFDSEFWVQSKLLALGAKSDEFVIDENKPIKISTWGTVENPQVSMKATVFRRPKELIDIDKLISTLPEESKKPKPVTKDEWLTLLITDTHIGKSLEAGAGTKNLIEQWNDSIHYALDDAEGYAGINIALGGDLIEGYMSQGGKNIAENDLLMTEQIETASRMVLKTIDLALAAGKEVAVAVCPGNHGDITRVQNTPMTNSYDVLIVKNVELVMERHPDKDRVTFYYPERYSGDVVYELGGVTYCLVHGHMFRGGLIKGASNWLRERALDADANYHDVNVVLAGHFHTPGVYNISKGKWVIHGSALEDYSQWFVNSSGSSSDSGIVSFVMRRGKPQQLSIN